MQFCIQTETDTVDLRVADQAALRQLIAVTDRVISATLKAGPNAFDDTRGHSIYLQRIEQLRDIVKTLVGGP